jgi:hypothetical protein
MLHLERAVVLLKVVAKVGTPSTFQPAMFWLKVVTDSNVLPIDVTRATFHPVMFWLKAEQ